MAKKSLFFVLLLTTLGGVYLWVRSPRHADLGPHNLTFANLQHGDMVDVVSATGIVEPRELLVVGSEMPGVVTLLAARVNDTVVEGALLAQLDDARIRLKCEEAENGVRTAQATLAQADAARDAADLALKAQIDLHNEGGFRTDRDQAQAQAQAARAGVQAAQARIRAAETALKDARLALDLTLIRAPLGPDVSETKRDYLVLDRKVQTGQMVGPQGGPLFILAGDLAVMELHAQVAEGDVNKVKKGQTAAFTVTGYSDEELQFRGTVREVRPLAVNVKGAVYYAAVIDVANQKDPVTGEWRLRPGMTASVDIIRREHKNVWKVPAAALNFQLEEAYQTDAIRARLAEWNKRADHQEWRPLWSWNAGQNKPWPLFIRIGGLKNGESGLKDGEGNEVLEWEPGREPAPNSPPPRVIINAPPARAPGFFDTPPNIKVT